MLRREKKFEKIQGVEKDIFRRRSGKKICRLDMELDMNDPYNK